MAGRASLPIEVEQAIDRGDLLDAIKLLRRASGRGLHECKAIVEAHARQSKPMPKRAAGPTRMAPAPAAGASAQVPAGALAALQQGDKIKAIRLMRQASGVGLKQAKDAIDALESAARTADDGLAPGEVPRSRTGAWLLWCVLVALALAALYRVTWRAG